MSAGVGLPSPSSTNLTSRRSRCFFHWRADDRSLVPLTGQAATFARAGLHGVGFDSSGKLYRPVHSQPAWSAVDADGDGRNDALGLLLEGSISNVVSNPEDDSNAAWTKTGVTVGTLAIPGPFGGSTSLQILTETTANSVHASEQSITITAGEWIFASRIVYMGLTRTRCRLMAYNGADVAGAVFRPLLGTQSNALGGNGQIRGTVMRNLGGGFWEIGVAVRVNAGSTSVNIAFNLIDDSDNVTYTGATTNRLGTTATQFLRCGTTGPTYQRYIGGSGAGPFTRSEDQLNYAAGAAFQLQDFTLYAKLERPAWADWTGSLNQTKYLARIGGGNPSCDLAFQAATRTAIISLSDASGNFSTQTVAMPSGRVIEVAAQVRNWRTGGSVAIDVGSGLSAFASALPNPVAAPQSTNLSLGNAGGTGFALDGCLLALKVLPGLRTLTQCQQSL